MVSSFAKVKIFRFWPKTMDHGFVFGSRKNVLRKVCHLKGNEKRNLTAFVSVTWHLRVWSYKRSKFLFTVHLNGETNLETKTFSTPRLKELQCSKGRIK